MDDRHHFYTFISFISLLEKKYKIIVFSQL